MQRLTVSNDAHVRSSNCEAAGKVCCWHVWAEGTTKNAVHSLVAMEKQHRLGQVVPAARNGGCLSAKSATPDSTRVKAALPTAKCFGAGTWPKV